MSAKAQYMFVHDSLVEFFKVGDTELSVQSFPKEYKVLTTAEDDEETTPLHKQFNVSIFIIIIVIIILVAIETELN